MDDKKKKILTRPSNLALRTTMSPLHKKASFMSESSSTSHANTPTMLDLLQTDTNPSTDIQHSSPFRSSSRAQSNRTDTGDEISLESSNSHKHTPGHAKKDSDPLSVREMLDSVSDKEAEKIIKIFQSPLDRKNLSTQINAVFSPQVDDAETVSPETEALSKKLKEQFEKKYQSIYGIVSGGENTSYNPLEAIRKRDIHEDKKKKLVKKSLKQRHDFPWKVDPQEIVESSTPQTVESENTPVSGKSKKRPWSFIFPKNKTSKGDVIKSSSPSEESLKVQSPSQVSLDDKGKEKSDDSSSNVRIVVSEDKETPGDGSKLAFVNQFSPYSAGETSISSGMTTPSSGVRRRQSHFHISPGYTPRREESMPTSALVSPEDNEDERKRGNIDRLKQKIRSIRKSSSMDSQELAIYAEFEDEKRGTRKGTKLPTDLSGDKARKILLGKSSSNSMKTVEETLKNYRYKKNLEIFEKTLKKEDAVESKLPGLEDQLSDGELYDFEVFSMKRQSRLVKRVKRNKLAIFEGVLGMARERNQIITNFCLQLSNSKEQVQMYEQLRSQSESLKSQKDEFLKEISRLKENLSFLLRNEVVQLEELHVKISGDVSGSFQTLEIANNTLNNDLIPGLNAMKEKCGGLLQTNQNDNNSFTEWGYALLAFVLSNAAWVFWIFSISKKYVRRMFGYEGPSNANSDAWINLDETSQDEEEIPSAYLQYLRTRRASMFTRTSASPSPSKESMEEMMKRRGRLLRTTTGRDSSEIASSISE